MDSLFDHYDHVELKEYEQFLREEFVLHEEYKKQNNLDLEFSSNSEKTSVKPMILENVKSDNSTQNSTGSEEKTLDLFEEEIKNQLVILQEE